MKFFDKCAEHVWNWMMTSEQIELLETGRCHPSQMDALMLHMPPHGVVCLSAQAVMEAGSEEAALKAKLAKSPTFYGRSIAEMLGREAPPAPEESQKKLHHNDGFFPNKVGRIDVLPRYPGVWG